MHNIKKKFYYSECLGTYKCPTYSNVRLYLNIKIIMLPLS